MTFLCSVPGADPPTFIAHAAIHLGLTGFVVAAGAWFLTKAVIAYRAEI
jgi:hypothetical protein